MAFKCVTLYFKWFQNGKNNVWKNYSMEVFMHLFDTLVITQLVITEKENSNDNIRKYFKNSEFVGFFAINLS